MSLAVSMHSGKGTYAVLLGSGVSSTADIPTGYQVTLDLIGKVAAMLNEDMGLSPEDWYREQFGERPGYSTVVSRLAGSQEDRQRLLRGYFEPSEEDKEEGRKLPTVAHRALATLAAGGHVRVILTTNFDKLMERALEAAGVVPTVVSTAGGMLPIQHNECTVVKVHGDYLDPSIKNTPEELASYDPEIETLLDRIFGEYGLVVCGWSGESDTALRKALERNANRKFAAYWATRSEPGEIAKELINIIGAEEIRISGADELFQDLAEKVHALEEFDRPHPLEPKVAVQTLKNHLARDPTTVRVHDLMMEEAEKLHGRSAEDYNKVFPCDTELLREALERIETIAEVAVRMIATGCYFGGDGHDYLWAKALERVANLPADKGEGTIEPNAGYYSGLLLLYAGGISAVAKDKYETLATLLAGSKVRFHRRRQPLAFAVHPWNVIERAHVRLLPELTSHYAPLNERLHAILRDPLRQILPDDGAYTACFDRFEYLLGLAHVAVRRKVDPYESSPGWGPIGLFAWRGGAQGRRGPSFEDEVSAELASFGEEWPPLRAGTFQASLAELKEIKRVYDLFVGEIRAAGLR